MKTTINPVLLLRIPAFALSDELIDVWEELKSAIAYASKDFYNKISHIKADELSGLDFKLRFTIWKYFNRAKYRGIPYGSFSGFALGKLSEIDDGVIFSNEQHLHRFKDWSLSSDVRLSETELSAPERFYFSNSSAYTTTRNIRFIALQDKVFELAEIERSIFIEGLLEYCTKPVAYADLLTFAAGYELEQEVLDGILLAMLDLQLVFTDLHTNIIGPEYFNRIKQEIDDSDEAYLIAEREVLSGGVPAGIFKHLPSCIEKLQSLVPKPEVRDMVKFKLTFTKRYEQRKIPLMLALDPELGIGYGDLEGCTGIVSIAQELSTIYVKEKAYAGSRNYFVNQLFKCIIESAKTPDQVVRMEHMSEPGSLPGAPSLPGNSFNALLRIAGDLVIVDQLGGCTATALSGRFSLASIPVRDWCREISTAETDANPDVIFFDLAYTAEGRVDNINRRDSIYNHELPILNYSCSNNPLSINDLHLMMADGELILFSQRYGKRVVPRLSSAYNYSRSDLSVYRFLCDFQHEQVHSGLSFDLVALLPELEYYPRIQYHNLVLSTAKWRVRTADLKNNNIGEVLRRKGVSRFFCVGEGDQTLCFDLDCTTELLYLESHVKKYNDFVISEIISTDKQLFKDSYKKSYFTQICLAIQHGKTLYKPLSHHFATSPVVPDQVIFPGKDWLYFEIYCHPQRMNHLLTGPVASFLETYEIHFKTWFFIRYNDPAMHIRLRIQMVEPRQGYFFISRLTEFLEPELEEGLITDIQLKSYKKETYRYGEAQMEASEQHFHVDSNHVLTMMSAYTDDHHHYLHCMQLMLAVLDHILPDRKKQLMLIREVQRSFELEHELTVEDFKKINKEWSNFLTTFNSGLLDDGYLLPQELVSSFIGCITASPAVLYQKIFCDLFHMHVNRLFTDHQRTHEMIIYNFLHKQLQLRSRKMSYS